MSSDKMNAYKKQKRYLRFFLRYTFMVKNIAPFFGLVSFGQDKRDSFRCPFCLWGNHKIK